jgi:Ca2+-binding RTX toxin-like protein
MASGNHDTLDFHQEAGNIVFYLGQGNDTASGGSGNDLFYGEGGADALTGNGGSDTFAFLSAADSNGAGGTGYDVLDFTAGIDKIKLADGTAVNVIDAAVSGTLSSASFDSDLSAVLGNGQLHELDQGHAVVFTANAGTLNAHVFLIVGTAAAATGYTAGNDYVFDVTAGSNFGALATTDFI